MKPLSPSKNCNKDLHFPETTSTAIALQNFLQEICSQTLSPRTFLVDGSSNCNLRHSLQSQIVIPTASFPECYVCCCESDWCYLWEDLTSCFGLKQIIKALVFSRLWFSKDFIGENKKNSSVQHIHVWILTLWFLLSYCFQYDYTMFLALLFNPLLPLPSTGCAF